MMIISTTINLVFILIIVRFIFELNIDKKIYKSSKHVNKYKILAYNIILVILWLIGLYLVYTIIK